MPAKTFISHSSKDKDFVKQIADKLKKENVWFDTWDIDYGDVLSEKVEAGIDEVKIFLIVLSQSSINSKWVQYELNMALIKYLENEDYKIVVVRIDDVEVPLRLKPFLYVDKEKCDNVVETLTEFLLKPEAIIQQKSFKRQFVNRHDEISEIQDKLYDEEISIIPIVGFFGIGKTSLLAEAFKRIYSNPFIVEINFTQAHIGSRLTLELCSKAGISIPEDGVSTDDLRKKNLLAIDTMLSKGAFIIFNKVESVLNDEGEPIPDLQEIIDFYYKKEILIKQPFILLSTRWLRLKSVEHKFVSFLKVDGLSVKHLSHILDSEIEKTSTNYRKDSDEINSVASHLHGYPLAAKLAAPIIVKYGAAYLLKNLHVISQLKVDIAEDIITKAKVSTDEISILEILAVFENPLESYYISDILKYDSVEFNKCIDNLVSFNLIETNADALLLHPLVSDFYLKIARTSPHYLSYAENLSEIAKGELKKCKPTDKQYVYWLTNACRMLFYCGKHLESRRLRGDLIGELKNAAIKLYERREYAASLELCNDFLESKQDDEHVLFTKARCLSRIGKAQESIDILETLIVYENNNRKIAKYKYAIGRAYIENSQKSQTEYLDKAQKYFLESIRINEHPTALQSMGELLFRKHEYEQAASFIERKLNESPKDPYALSTYADILWAMGRRAEALEKIISALQQQRKNPNFIFRAGRFLLEENQLENAYSYFLQAVELDESYFDARLSLCDVCIDLDKMEEAKLHLDYLKPRIKGDKANVLESILANYYLRVDKIDKAEVVAEKLVKSNRNVVTLGLLAKVYIAKYKESSSKNLDILAESYKDRANDLIDEGLKLEPANERLEKMKKYIQ